MTSIRIFFLILLLLAGSVLSSPMAQAQSASNDFSLGNQLLRQGEFEEAYEIFRNLMQENPRSFAVYDRAVTALINLKRYDEAIEISLERLEHSGADVNTMVKLGEVYHIAGQRKEARDTWNRVIDRHGQNLHAFRRIVETMNQHRLYREAIDVYKTSREQLGDPTLFTYEIAGNYLAVREFEPALHAFLDLLAEDERQLNRIQRQLVSYDERDLYDMAIIVTRERIENERTGSTHDLRFRDFLIWLNMERGLYRRALAEAKTLERYSENEMHVLFRIGRQLRSQQEFELAEEAFNYYLDLEHHPLQARSYEELSRSYQDWAGFLVDHNLDFGGAADTLYQKAYDTVERLTYRFPRYERMMEILTIQSELALDHLKRPDAAESYHKKMEQAIQSEADEALAHYIDGRILLFRGDFSMARVAFTRSNRLAGSGEIAERSRYYLGLGDFYNNDFTYARMQLRSLERQNTSWFANNALRLRYVIQQAYDEGEENESIKRYARARYLYDTGRYNEAAGLLAPVLQEPAGQKLHGETALLLSRTLRRIHPEVAFLVIHRHTMRPSIRSNAGEQLLWERARLGELVYVMHKNRSEGDDGSRRRSAGGNDGRRGSGTDGSGGFGSVAATDFSMLILPPELLSAVDLRSAEERFYQRPDEDGQRMPFRHEMVVDFYEELLVHYPDGFYADLARTRVRDLERTSREL